MISLNKQYINTTISERYARIIYSFDFENTRSNPNQSDELRFAITIDPDAFIAGFTANIDGELFVGCTKEKQEARQEYTAAKEKNENAILISQPNKEISNVFQISTNIDSQSKITLNVTVEQYLQKRFHYNQLNIQLLNDFSGTTIRKNYSDIEYTFVVKDQRGISNLEIPLYKSGNINQNNKYIYNINGKISLQQLSLTNELVLKYKVDGESDESSLLFDEKSNTFCHIISDVINDAKEQNIATETEGGNSDAMSMEKSCLIPRRVCFVIDRSGSMSGNKWNYTVKATIMALKKLRHGIDRFRIILCGSQLDYIPKHINDLQLVEEKIINDSIKYLSKQNATGCELLNDGLLEGIKAIKMDILKLNNDANMKYNFYMNQIVFISDGQPTIGETNVDKIILNVKSANDISVIDKYSNKISIFAFGVGRDGNGSEWMNDLPHHFLKSLSVNNNGFYKRIKQQTADKELNEYINIFSKPISCNINIKYTNQIKLNNLTQTKFDSLYEGNDLIICGKLPTNKTTKHIIAVISSITCKQVKSKNNKVQFKPTTINKTIKISLEKESTINNNNVNNIERIWAYLTLQQYATQKLKYSDMIEMDEDEQKEQDQIPLTLAMKYRFVTPWTSMIVVKEKQTEEKKEEKEAPKIPKVTEQKQKQSFLLLCDDEDDYDDQFSSLALHCAADDFDNCEEDEWLTFEPEEDCAPAAYCEADDLFEVGGLDDEPEILTLKSGGANPITFEISKNAAETSKFCTTILEGDADATSIEIRQVPPDILKFVVYYLNNCKNKTWDAMKWINTFDLRTTIRIFDAANYMDIKKLCHLTNNVIIRTEKRLNQLIDETIKGSKISSDVSLTLKDCTVSNMVYLIKQVINKFLLELETKQKEIIFAYILNEKIDAQLFISLTEKNELIKNIILCLKKENIYNQSEILDKALQLLKIKVLEIID